ncbi:Transcriptional regulator, LysR family (fragment) [Cupriavidus taiwanensis]
MKRVDVEPRIGTHNAELRLKAAIDGQGVARLSPRFVQEQLELGQLVRVLPAYASSPLKVYVLMPARKLMPQACACSLTCWSRPSACPRRGARRRASARH